MVVGTVRLSLSKPKIPRLYRRVPQSFFHSLTTYVLKSYVLKSYVLKSYVLKSYVINLKFQISNLNP